MTEQEQVGREALLGRTGRGGGSVSPNCPRPMFALSSTSLASG